MKEAYFQILSYSNILIIQLYNILFPPIKFISNFRIFYLTSRKVCYLIFSSPLHHGDGQFAIILWYELDSFLFFLEIILLFFQFHIFLSYKMKADDDLEYQLKLHNLEKIILTKQHEIQVLQAKLEAISSTKIDSEEDIITVIVEVHKAMKGVERTVAQIKDPCYQLNLNSLYELFKNISYVMINAVRLLAEGCQNGVQRNLLNFTPIKVTAVGETQCLQKVSDTNQGKEKQNTTINIANTNNNTNIQNAPQKKQQYYNEVRAQMEIDRIYESIQSEKVSVQKITYSNVAYKLNEVHQQWMSMINEADKLLQEGYARRNEGIKQNFAEKLHKPDYITKVMKEELSTNIKKYFKQSVEKTVKKLYSDFYAKEQKKLREQILNAKPKTVQTEQQTDIQGLNKIKNVMKQKKAFDKLAKQLEQANKEKHDIAEQYIRVNRTNQLYLLKIQQLEKKILNLNPVRHDKKLHETRNSFNLQRKNSLRALINFNDSQLEAAQNNQNVHIASTVQEVVQKSKKDVNEYIEIIKKKSNMKRIYYKSRMHTENTRIQPKSKDQQRKSIDSFDFKSANKNQQDEEQNSTGGIKINGQLKQVNEQKVTPVLRKVLEFGDSSLKFETKKNTPLPKPDDKQKKQAKPQIEKVAPIKPPEKIFNSSEVRSVLQVKKIFDKTSESQTQQIKEQTSERDQQQQPTLETIMNQMSETRYIAPTRNIRQSLLINGRRQSELSSVLRKNSNIGLFNNSHPQISQEVNIQPKPILEKVEEKITLPIILNNNEIVQQSKIDQSQNSCPQIKPSPPKQKLSKSKFNPQSQIQAGMKMRRSSRLHRYSDSESVHTPEKGRTSTKFQEALYSNRFFTQSNGMNRQKLGNLNERFERLNLQNGKKKGKQNVRKPSSGILLSLKKEKQANNLNVTLKLEKKVQKQPTKTIQVRRTQPKMINIQKLRTSFSVQPKKIPKKEQVVKDIIQICKNSEATSPNLQVMLNQYVQMILCKLKLIKNQQKRESALPKTISLRLNTQ